MRIITLKGAKCECEGIIKENKDGSGYIEVTKKCENDHSKERLEWVKQLVMSPQAYKRIEDKKRKEAEPVKKSWFRRG